jgi:hypothetical protein
LTLPGGVEIFHLSEIPTLQTFDPTVIPFQINVLRYIRKEVDHTRGIPEILLSGAVGSAKTILMSHLIITHCMMYPRACALIGRRALSDLRDTLYAKILEHLECLDPIRDYTENKTRASITFRNGSQIISRSWADGKILKMRSHEFSAAAIEEMIENDDLEYYTEIKMRVGRLSHVPESFIIGATNPGSPAHPLYDYFIERQSEYRKVFYSVTLENPFLPKAYIDSQVRDMDPKLARRMLYGEWIELHDENIYYAYRRENNYRDCHYEIDKKYPILISYDFNIALGKPLSAVLMQFIADELHIFGEIVVEGMRTLDAMDEVAERGLLDMNVKIYIHGDATGRNKDTRNVKSDYDLIRQFLDNYRTKQKGQVTFETSVPLSNPPVRKRWALVNAYCENLHGVHRLFVYKDAPTADKALRLTALKTGGRTTEDDSKPYQHIGTAIGYGLWAQKNLRREQRTVKL